MAKPPTHQRPALLPLLEAVRALTPKELWHDLLAGITLATFVIPAGMGYAVASGLPPAAAAIAVVSAADTAVLSRALHDTRDGVPRPNQELAAVGLSNLLADLLQALKAQLANENIGLCFAELKGPVKDRLRRSGLYETFRDTGFHPTNGSAVRDHLQHERLA